MSSATGTPTLPEAPPRPPTAGAAAADPHASAWRLPRRLVREPLVQFLLLGALLFAVSAGLDAARNRAQREIVVDQGVVERLALHHRLQAGVAPTRGELEALIDDHVREEVLYREAIALGLDRDDEIVRRRLVQKIDFFQRELAAVPEPTEEELRTYYRDHPQAVREPARVTFVHVYITPGPNGGPSARRRAAVILERLGDGVPEDVAGRGDRSPLPSEYAGLDREAALRLFGATPMTEGLFTEPPGRWFGPVESSYGWHLAFIRAREDAVLPSFDAARDRVRAAWVEDRRREADRKRHDAMRSRYTVIRRDRPEP